MQEHELADPEMPEGAEEAAIEELQNATDFPVPMGADQAGPQGGFERLPGHDGKAEKEAGCSDRRSK